MLKRVWKGKCYRAVEMETICEKMADFENHRRFTLRHLIQDVIPVSVKNNNIRDEEKQLMNECIRFINDTIELGRQMRDTCIKKLRSVLD